MDSLRLFLHKYDRFLLSLLFAGFGLAAFVTLGLWSPHDVVRADARALATLLSADNTRVEERLTAEAAARAESGTEGINALPVFLNHINSIAQATEVIIDELMPAPQGAGLNHTLKLRTDYLTFLRFASRLESLNVVITDIQLRPYDPVATPPTHAITFSITPRNNAEPLTSDRLAALAERVAEPDKRDPFQRFAYHARTDAVTREVELTWIHHLTGISRVGAERVATIDGQDFRTGDTLGDRIKISSIEADHILLQRVTDDGTTHYILRFRRSALD